MLCTDFILRGAEPVWFKFTEGEAAEEPYYQVDELYEDLDRLSGTGVDSWHGNSNCLWTIYGNDLGHGYGPSYP